MINCHYEVQLVSHVDSIVYKESVSSLLKHTAFNYMDQLDGWCSYNKAALLIDLILLIQPQKIVEIGVWGGKSLVPMACALKANKKGKIYGIDPWDPIESLKYVTENANINYWGHADHEGVLRNLQDKIEKFQLEEHVELLRMTSASAPKIEEIDILHIDGNHTDATTFLDVTKWVPLVKKGGWIVFDDMTWFESGVFTAARAVAWLDEHCVRLAEFSENCDWGIWYKL